LALNAKAATLDQTCERAMELQLAGDTNGAQDLYRSILQAAPSHAAANYCLGMLHVQLRRPIDGMPLLLAALDAHPEIPDYWLGYLEAMLLAGHIREAAEALALGREHGLAGSAVEEFAARLNLGVPQPGASLPPVPSKSTGSLEPRARKQRTPSGRKSRSPDEHAHTLTTLVAQMRLSEALPQARKMTRRFPDQGLGWKYLGGLLWAEGSADEALSAMRTSTQLLPRDAEAHCNLGIALAAQKRSEEAEVWLRKAVSIESTFAAAHYHLGMCLERQARYAAAEASIRTAIALRPRSLGVDSEHVFSNLLYLMDYNPDHDAEFLFTEHRRFGELFEAPLRASWPRHTNVPDPDRCLRIGFVSGDFRDHPVATFMEPLLARLMRSPGLELHAYYNGSSEDRVTTRLRGYFRHWQPISAMPDAALAERIKDDHIDILVDLSGHTAMNRLPAFARKPSPIQVSWIGYPGTTGLHGMDYYLGDPHWLPPGRFDRHFVEKLVYLPAAAVFQPNAAAPPVNALPALATGRITFGSFNRLGKINAATIALWAQLLRALPESSLILADVPLDGRHNELIERFTAEGIEANRLTVQPRVAMDAYLSLHHHVDVCLDTTPYTGGTTTQHALWMGVPTLTLAGTTPAARQGAGVLGRVGLEGFTATDAADFVAKGIYWARHPAELAELRSGLRERFRHSPAQRPDLLANELESAFRCMWQRWCAGLPAETFHSAHGPARKTVEDFAPRPAAAAQPPKLPRAASRARPRDQRRQLDALQVMIAQGRHAEALGLARSMTESFPLSGLCWKTFGALLWWAGKQDEALLPMQHSARLLPGDAETQSNHGMALLHAKRVDEAVKSFERALRIDSAFAAAHYHLGLARLQQGRYAEAQASLDIAVSLKPEYLTAEVEPCHSILLFLYSHDAAIDADTLFAEHRRYGRLIEDRLEAVCPRRLNPPDPERVLRIGFVSGDLKNHAVAGFIEPVLERLRKYPGVELHAYYNETVEDEVTVRLRAHFKQWNAVALLSDPALSDLIVSHQIDILIDLSGPSGLNRLHTFARKPAPIQVSWIGYPGTTGLRAMDYYLGDRHWLPPGQFDRHFVEKLVYLPAAAIFQPEPAAPQVAALPALATGHLTFGSFNRLGKINPVTIGLWSQLLRALPASRLILAGIPQGGEPKQLIDRFAAEGVARERLDFHPRGRLETYLALHHRVDICLDTLPYNGGTTTQHALWMGVPTLTIAGTTPAGRQGAGILARVRLEEFVAADSADFVAKGVRWAAELGALAELRAGLRERCRQSPSHQPDVLVRALDAALRRMWTRWCAGLPAESFAVDAPPLVS
jgi:predicted O-linked N-acetylglucosamine transferase (SPINDLY family)